MTGFSESAWRAVAPTYAEILDHPFVSALREGTLGEDVFARYLLDDAHYLTGYARTLAALAARMPDPEGIGLLAGSAAGAVVAERELHRAFLVPRGIDPDAPDAPAPTPTCLAYTGFLLTHAATSPVEVGLAAVLPCFRVYAEVGRAIAGSVALEDHPYAAWIAAYSDPDFEASVVAVQDAADALASTTSSEHLREMHAAYATATRLEWRFWDASWCGETL
ncbi:aminopyrimidine aminohydrolase [Marmoricola endophyticus]|uniref:Aminopyrimidine aminohydrolase n=1 Tax=Marmoricola endophyticus TaxID=2040280 RepID=A0A917BFD8_9ACTN|nr:TenA family protein [Marmoricola endophyticus]GGF39539.1 aminopyrimidine aminohydrolase [Marmoricola endophyticus]